MTNDEIKSRIKELETEHAAFDNLQMAYKVALNSLD